MSEHARLVVYLEPHVAQAFVDLARANDRAATAEARIALKKHMDAAGIEVPTASATRSTSSAGVAAGGGSARSVR
jgi:hypothetical protein